MAVEINKLGNYIREANLRNSIGIDNLYGLSMSKEFRKSTSNIIGVDLSKYKIVKQNQFACDFMSPIRVNKLPVVINKTGEDIIVSPAYPVFEVIDASVLDPDYLMLWFRRSEFDRHVVFQCDGGVRGGYGWTELCNEPIVVPDIEKQREIVNEYQIIQKKIADNNNRIAHLSSLCKMLYKKIISGIEPNKTISEVSKRVITGKTPSTNRNELWGGSIPFVTIPDMHGNVFIENTERYLSNAGSESRKTTIIPFDAIIVSCIATVGLVGISTQNCHTNQQINSIIPKNKYDEFFIYESLLAHVQELQSLGEGGSATLNVSKSKLENMKIEYPEDDTIREKYSKTCAPLFESIRTLEKENICLDDMLNVIIRRLKKISQEES